MKYFSTRDKAHMVTIEEALLAGLARDGGLFVPETFPKINIAKAPRGDIKDFAAYVLTPFFAGSSLAALLPEICAKAFAFEIPLKKLSETRFVLELTHGPTCAFKDVGAQFLAATLSHISVSSKLPRLVLVATSGDTGGAVGCAFSGQENTRVVILYPLGRISDRQEHQLTCWQENVNAYAVEGTFDDCQRIVKEAFLDRRVRQSWQLLSANSISLGRLLPQMIYYAYVANQNESGEPINFIIPTGNLGNGLAAIWAKQCGFKIGKIGLALNANKAIANFLATEDWAPQKTVPTLANAMDVGNASNMERLRALLLVAPEIKGSLSALSVTDDQIKEMTRQTYRRYKYIVCPHTATAFYAAEKWAWPNAVLVATADPAKFNDIVEPIIGAGVPVPPALASILNRPMKRTKISATLDDLFDALAISR